MPRPADWTERDSQDNALATAERAAEEHGRHVIMYAVASYEISSTSGLLQIKQGGVVVAEHYIHGADVVPLELYGEANQAASAELAPSGTGGVLGKVTLVGYTE